MPASGIEIGEVCGLFDELFGSTYGPLTFFAGSNSSLIESGVSALTRYARSPTIY
jgi:hypothetical protein